MTVKVMDSSSRSVNLNDSQTDLLYSAMSGISDPRISSCIQCRSAVVATEPFSTLLDELSILHPNESDFFSSLIDLVENSQTVHLYILEVNECVHVLWRDPLATEWTNVTGEKRLHH